MGRVERRQRRAISAYDHRRSCVDHGSICNAPSTNMYFAATGAVAPCWGDIGTTPEYWSPDHSILEIWQGRFFGDRRAALGEHRFEGTCTMCLDRIVSGLSPLAAVYDRTEPDADLPVSFELELSNLCNLECVMCNGMLSSRIRRNRDGLEPLVSPYDDTFVDQLADLLPVTRDLRFSGGEPLLHPIMHNIADRVADLRPDLPIAVSTNGSVRSTRVLRLLERSEVRMFLSFDSLQKDRYEAIRIGGDFDVLMRNIDAFAEHFATGRGFLVINTNPMRSNWDEMAGFARWCTARGLELSFNTVVEPAGLSLRTLPAVDLRAIRDQLRGESFDDTERTPVAATNTAEFGRLVDQVASWAREAEEREQPTAVAAPRRRA